MTLREEIDSGNDYGISSYRTNTSRGPSDITYKQPAPQAKARAMFPKALPPSSYGLRRTSRAGHMGLMGQIDHAKRVDFFAKPRCIRRGEQRKTERSSNA